MYDATFPIESDAHPSFPSDANGPTPAISWELANDADSRDNELHFRTLKRLHLKYMDDTSRLVHRVAEGERDKAALRGEVETLGTENEARKRENQAFKDRMHRLETRLAQLAQSPRGVTVRTAVSSSSSSSRRRVVRRVLGDE